MPNVQYLTETEDIIRNIPQLYEQLNTGKKVYDFNKLDYVKCTYIKGVMQVVGVTVDAKVIVQPVMEKHNTDLEAISPEFLVQTKLDNKVMDLLYGRKN